mgnify:FL=1
MNTTARQNQLKDWLAKTVGADHCLEPLAGDASLRRYYRVSGAKVSGTRVVMDAPPEAEPVEPFVRIAARLSQARVLVPEIEAVDLERGFLLLTDLGDRLFLGLLRQGNEEALYARAIDALIAMQRKVDVCGLPKYDAVRLRDELMLFPRWFLGRHLGRSISRTEIAELDEVFSLLEASALEQPQYFVHRDYHSRNLLDVNGAVGVLDFQDAVQGPLTYDLVSLLRDVYIRWPETNIRRWIEQYRQEALAAGLLDANESARFVRWFDLMGVQRHLKIAGIFARLFYRDGKPGYLPDLPLTLGYLNAVVPHYPELATLGRLLEDIVRTTPDAVLVTPKPT